ncbi:MAG: TetR/AcrR family transcriptional regulator C-terminal domain-containing protein [Candidatus Dormibacterales bacterium]
MAIDPNPTSKRRARLTRERVLRAAMALADKGGIGSLTMRNLGQKLGVEAMALYNHVANKDAILDGIVDLVFSEIELPSDVDDWRAAMRRRAISARDALLRHPWAVGLMQSRLTPGAATLRHHDSVIGSLTGAGFSIEMAAHAYSVMDSYIYGFAMQQLTLVYDSTELAGQAAQAFLGRIPPALYPNLDAMIREHAMKTGYDYAQEFEFGLDLILAALENFRSTNPSERTTGDS